MPLRRSPWLKDLFPLAAPHYSCSRSANFFQFSRYSPWVSGLERSGRRSDERNFRKQQKHCRRKPPQNKKDQVMKNLPTKTAGSYLTSAVRVTAPLLALILFAAVAQGHGGRHGDGHKIRPPRVPAGLEVPAGNELASCATGVGMQIYVWSVNPTNAALASWVFKAPHAVLFASHEDERGDVVGIHFAGPTWQGNDGSKVVGVRMNSVAVNSDAIPWLLLRAASTSGDGKFTNTTYIQRLNTLGGLAPTTPGSTLGEEALVPYIADYYFYHAQE